MFPLRLSLFALLLLAVFSIQSVEGSPRATIESIEPQIINLDDFVDEIDWKNNTYLYENHNNFTPLNHTWTHNYSEPGDDWKLPNPVWNLSQGAAEQDVDKDQIWGPSLNCDNETYNNSEFCMYGKGGSGSLFTENYDVSDLSYDISLYLSHRYNFDYYSGYTSYNGGQVRISTDNGTSWELLEPYGGYPGTMYNYEGYGNPLYGQKGFVHCGDCSDVSGSASDNQDKWITTSFPLTSYLGTGQVKFQFIVGMYDYQWEGDGEHWYIDEFSIAESPEYLYFLGNASDIDGNITDYQWNSTIDGNFGNTENLTFILNSFQRLSIGNHTISFTARNEEGNWSDEDYSWLIILRNPGIEWINVPDDFSTDVSPFIEFSITTPVNFSTRCKLDEEEWYDCDSTNNFSNLTQREHSFAVNATDEFGYYNLSYFNWTVINNPPNVDYSVSETPIRQYHPLSVSCSASDSDGYIVKYRWALVDSSDRQNTSKDFVLYEGENPNTTFSNITVGNHWITCRAFDNDGDWNLVQAITSIYIKNNTKPQADIEEIVPDLAEYGRSVEFYGNASDDNFTIEKYEWSSNVDGTLSNTRNFTTSSLGAGWHTIYFRVRDSEGLWSDHASKDLFVNIIPTAYAGENVSTTPNVPIQFNGQGEDEDGNITKYEWDFDGDGIYDWADEFNGRELNLYNNAGTYTAVLRVTDNDGSTSTDEVTVKVTEKDVVIDLGDGEIDAENGTIEFENGTVDLVETDEGLPGFGTIAAMVSIGLIARFRRR